MVGYIAQMGNNVQLSAACSSNKDCACVCVCMYVYVRERKEICRFMCAGMSDDWVIYSSELYVKWIFKQKRIMTTCCVYAMCTSALANDCE